jgi:hypothetical protein
MSEQLPHDSTPEFQAPKKRDRSRILLTVFAGILATSCLVCGVVSYFVTKPGKPIPATAFIDEKTRGIVALRIDPNEPGLRELLSMAAGIALERNYRSELKEMLEFFKEKKLQQAPAVTLVGSYMGSTPDELRAYGILVLSELPGLLRWRIEGAYKGLAQSAEASTYQGARIASGGDLIRNIRERREASEKAPPLPENAAFIEELQLSLFESCLFVGRSVEDVEAAITAFHAPDPAVRTGDEPEPREGELPFVKLYRRADSSALCFGALSNENDILLAAVYPEAGDREAARERLEPVLTLDPRQVRKIAFSAKLASADEGVVKLWVEGANADTAEQIAAAVRAFVESKLSTTEEIPLEVAIVEDETKIEGATYQATIRITGIKALVESAVTEYFKRRAAEQEAASREEAERPGGEEPPPKEEPQTLEEPRGERIGEPAEEQ